MTTSTKEIDEMLATLNLQAENHLVNPIREFLGLPTSAQLIGEAFNQGINRRKLQEVVDDLNEMLREVTEATNKTH